MTKYTPTKANMFNHEAWVKTDNPEILAKILERVLIAADFNIVNFTDYYFPVAGYTCVWILAESHLALHHFAEEQKSYIQLSSCNEEKLLKFKILLNASLNEIGITTKYSKDTR